MENSYIFLYQFLVPVITLLIEYLIIKPIASNLSNSRGQRQNTTTQVTQIQIPNDVVVTHTGLEKAYQVVSLGLVGGTAGVTAGSFIRLIASIYIEEQNPDFLTLLLDPVAHSNLLFIFISIICFLGGIGLTFIVLINSLNDTEYWKLILTAIFMGFLGGFVIWIALSIGLFIFMVYELITSSTTGIVEHKDDV